MGTYLEPIAGARNGIVVSADGSIFVNLLLRGINVNPYDPQTLAVAQRENHALLNAVSAMTAISEATVSALKVRVSPRERALSMIQGMQKVTNEEYPDLLARVEHFYNEMAYGGHEECRRVYVASLRLNGDYDAAAAALMKVGAVAATRGTDWDGLARAQTDLMGQIPSSFKVEPASPMHLHLAHERMRGRGLWVPEMPEAHAGFSPTAFAPVAIDKTGESEALFAEFVERANRATEQAKDSRWRQWVRNYRSVRWASDLVVYSPEERSEAMPDGPGARQTLMAIAAYPDQTRAMINDFTYIADENTGLDIDWTMRFEFDQHDISTGQHRAFESNLDEEAAVNARDRHDLSPYRKKMIERAALSAQVESERGPRAVAVTTIFALAHPNRKVLAKGVRALRERFEENRFVSYVPVGGQFDLLRQMLPAVKHSDLVKDLMGVTTTRKLSACFPIRRTEIGDAVGIPMAINKENGLGQIVLMDFLGSTDKGSGSMMVTGAQGAGKSYFLKTCIDWLNAMRRPTTIFDQSESREYMSHARSLGGRVQVVEALAPRVSLDPLKVFAPADGDTFEAAEQKMQFAKMVFMEVAQVLFAVPDDAEEMLLLSQMLTPATRRAYNIRSSRDLIRVLLDGGFASDRGHDKLSRALRSWAGHPFSGALFDRVDVSGHVEVLPAYRRSENSDAVVFVTHGLPIVTGEPTNARERYSLVLHTVMAWITTEDHARIPGLCALVADEVSFWRGSSVLKRLLGEPDKTGRKEQNIVLAGGQLAKHFGDDSYDLIRKVLTLRQESDVNAAAALEKGGFPSTPKMVRELTHNTSPADPDNNNFPVAGREGEGFYNDGFGGRAKVKLLAMANAEGRRLGDTTASKMVRERDLQPVGAAK